MFWMHYPRTFGLLITLPAVPAMIAVLVWVLAPSDPANNPSASPVMSVPDGHQRVRQTLGLDLDLDRAGAASVTPAGTAAVTPTREGTPGATLGNAQEPMRRVGIYRDGRQVGWVAATPAMLAAVAEDHLDEMARRADLAQERSLEARDRFAEAHMMSQANQEARSGAGQRITRARSGLARLAGSQNAVDRGPRFQRLDFVDALAQDRNAVRRASARRSRTSGSSARR